MDAPDFGNSPAFPLAAWRALDRPRADVLNVRHGPTLLVQLTRAGIGCSQNVLTIVPLTC